MTEQPTPEQVREVYDADAHFAVRSPINRAIYRVLRDHRMSNMVDEDGDPYPLLDLMSNPAPADISTGEWEMMMLADDIEEAQAAAELTRLRAEIARKDEALDKIAPAIMNALWPVLGGNHTDAEVWQSINDCVRAAVRAAIKEPNQ